MMTYSISEVSKIVGIPQTTIRYWDKKGLLPFGVRSGPGYRVFDHLDINWLNFLNYLKEAGMSIEDMQRYIRYYIQGDSTLCERRDIVYESLRRINKQIDALKAAQSFMEFKCWVYDAAIDIGSLDDVVNIPREQMPPVVQETLKRIGGFHPTYVSELEAREAHAAGK